jgi:hypothetical protein
MAETTNYLILGYAVIFIVMGLHVYSLISRAKRVRDDLALLEEMDKE